MGGLSNYKPVQYLDISLLKKVGEQEETPITNTTSLIKVTFAIPSDFIGKAEYSVIRVHGDETTALEDKDSDPNTVTIETDKFSTYALAYREIPAPSTPSGGNSGRPRPVTPTENDNPGTTSSDISSDTSSDTSSDDENNHASGEINPSNNDNNPSTGVAVSIVPLAAAITVLTITAKQKKK